MVKEKGCGLMEAQQLGLPNIFRLIEIKVILRAFKHNSKKCKNFLKKKVQIVQEVQEVQCRPSKYQQLTRKSKILIQTKKVSKVSNSRTKGLNMKKTLLLFGCFSATLFGRVKSGFAQTQTKDTEKLISLMVLAVNLTTFLLWQVRVDGPQWMDAVLCA